MLYAIDRGRVSSSAYAHGAEHSPVWGSACLCNFTCNPMAASHTPFNKIPFGFLLCEEPDSWEWTAVTG